VGWTGIAGPAELSDEVAQNWGEWLATATNDEKGRQQMQSMGSVIELMSPEESRNFIQTQYEIFRQLVDELGMRVEG
jgi:tripartite-type tricarboxylate transporter receptor subunit TctC